MKDRILQVSGVVPNKSEEEICVALHDHDYDPERAITSLLDADAKQVRAAFVCFVRSTERVGGGGGGGGGRGG